jgi:hypothetical protein
LTSVLNPVITTGLSGRSPRLSSRACVIMRGPEVRVDRRDDRLDDEPPPVLGSWKRLYAAVLLNALFVMALVFVFSRWPY